MTTLTLMKTAMMVMTRTPVMKRPLELIGTLVTTTMLLRTTLITTRAP